MKHEKVTNFLSNYNQRFPFDCNTPVGYLGCITSQAATVFVGGELFVCTLTLTVGFCLFVTDFILDLEENLRQLNEIISTTSNDALNIEDHLEAREKFFGIIQFHAEAKRQVEWKIDVTENFK